MIFLDSYRFLIYLLRSVSHISLIENTLLFHYQLEHVKILITSFLKMQRKVSLITYANLLVFYGLIFML